MDVINMEQFSNLYFDLVIDKGTLDALLCGDYSFLKAAFMLKEVQRVLKINGIYLAISYGTPVNRVFHFVSKLLK